MLIKRIKIFCVIISLLLLTSCSSSQTIVKDTLDEPIIHNVYNFNGKATTDVLSICNSIGNINIINSNADELKIVVNLVQTKEVKDIDKKLNNLLIKPQIKNGITLYEPLSKNNENSNFWEWIYTDLNANGISINFDIEIPSTIKELRIYNSLGNINIQNISAKIYAQTNIGNINGKNLNPLDKATFKVNIPLNESSAINLDFSNINNANTIIAATELGKIDLNLPSNSIYTQKQKSLNDITVRYPFLTTSKKYFNYCRKESFLPITPIAKKGNKTIIKTATTNNSNNISIKTK